MYVGCFRLHSVFLSPFSTFLANISWRIELYAKDNHFEYVLQSLQKFLKHCEILEKVPTYFVSIFNKFSLICVSSFHHYIFVYVFIYFIDLIYFVYLFILVQG